jgi:outer membrane protein assembly factor BamB
LLNIEKQGDGGLAPKLEWDNHRVLKTKFTNVSVVGPYAYALSDGILECVKVADGEQVWKGKRYGQGQILVVGDVILVTVEMKGDVAMVDASPKAFKELGRLDAIDGQMWNNLCLYGNLLLVRNAEEAACYELPLRE